MELLPARQEYAVDIGLRADDTQSPLISLSTPADPISPFSSRDMADQEPTASISILKPTSAYDDTLDADAQFFPTEDRPPIAALPMVNSDPMEDDYDDPDGSTFAGPAARSVPTSRSGFRMRARSRGELDRMSRDLERSRDEREDAEDSKSVGGRSRRSRRSSKSKGKSRSTRSSRRGSNATTEGEETDDAGSTTSKGTRSASKKAHRRSRPPSPTSSDDDEPRAGFFQGLSNAIRGRPSFSHVDSTSTTGSRPASTRSKLIRRRSDDDDAVSVRSESEVGDDDDPYGPYGSSDTTSTSSTQSSSSSQDDGPRRRRGGGGGFLGLTGGNDPFGESRIDFEGVSDDEGSPSRYDGSPVDRKGKHSLNAQQSLYIPDEDLQVRLVGLGVSRFKSVLWTTGCVLSGGSLWLLGRWVPKVWLRSVGKPGEFEGATYVVIEVSPISTCSWTATDDASQTHHHPPQITPIESLTLPHPISLASLFPPSLISPPAHRDDVVHPNDLPPDGEASVISLGLPAISVDTPAMALAKAKKVKGVMVDSIRYVDYRYYRLLLHPEGEFRMVR